MTRTRVQNTKAKQFVVMNKKKGITIVGQWFTQSKSGEATLYDEKTADLILGLMQMRGIKGFTKYEWLG